jgi:acetyltransferase-like isoleucine patch superfamily enzyme
MKSLLKISAQYIAAFVVLPLTLLFFILSIFGEDNAIASLSHLLSLIPGKSGCYLRSGFYRFTLKRFHPSAVVSFGTIFSHVNTEISEYVYIGPQCNIGSCSIGSNTLIGSGVHIMSGKEQHNFTDPNLPLRYQGGSFQKVVIKQNCWLGNGALIMVDIGERCVVAAGSVVVTEVKDNSIVAGNPAKKIKDTHEG